MRQLPSNITDAFDAPAIETSYRMTVFQNRVYFDPDELDISYSHGLLREQGILDDPLPEDTKYDPYSGLLLSVYSQGGRIKVGAVPGGLMEPYNDFGYLSGDGLCRPSIAIEERDIFITYFDSGDIKQVRLSRDLLRVGNPECIVSNTTLYSLGKRGAIHSLGADEHIVLWINEGGISVGYLTGFSMEQWGKRFMNPTVVYLDSSDADILALNYSAAIRFNDSIFVYLSRKRVIGLERKSSGVWSDTFDAVPADLSNFAIANALITPNGTLHLCGQFQREDDLGSFSSSHVYGLDLWSPDGRTFSLDRFTMFTRGNTEVSGDLGHRFMEVVVEGNQFDTVMFAAAGNILRAYAPYSISGEKAEYLTIPATSLLGVTGDPDQAYLVRLANLNDFFMDHPILLIGNVAILEIGAAVGEDTYDYYRASTSIIASKGTEITDGRRVYQVTLVPESAWRAGTMTHPFYLEFNSKQSLNDKGTMENLADVSTDTAAVHPLIVDLWNSEPSTAWDQGENTIRERWTGDFKEDLGHKSYPKITTLPFDIYVYGWSRAGIMSPYDGSSDINHQDSLNNDVSLKLEIIDLETNIKATLPVTSLAPGNVNYWPQTYGTGAHGRGGGNNPIVFRVSTANGVVLGNSISRIAVVTENTNDDDHTVSLVERIEAPDLAMKIAQGSDTWEEIEYEVNTLKGLVISTSQSIYYLPDIYNDTEWIEWKTGLPDGEEAQLKSIAYGSHEDAYYCVTPSGIYKASGLGRPWTLMWDNASIDDHMVGVAYTGSYVYAGNGEFMTVSCDEEGRVMMQIQGDIYTGETYGTITNGGWFAISFDGLVSYTVKFRMDHPDEEGNDVHPQIYDWQGAVGPNGGMYGFTSYTCGWGVGGDSHLVWFDTFGNRFADCNVGGFSASTFHPAKRYQTTIQNGYAGISKLTTDGSCTFTLLDVPVLVGGDSEHLNKQYMDICPFDVNRIAWNHSNNVYLSSDGGNTWGTIPRPRSTNCVLFSPFDTIGIILGGRGNAPSSTDVITVSFDDYASHMDLTFNLGDMHIGANYEVNRVIPLPGLAQKKVMKRLKRIACPTIMFATKPFSTFNFSSLSLFKLVGEGAWGGSIGLGKDGDNYLAAIATPGELRIIKVRDGMTTELASTSIASNYESYWILFEHRDGVLRAFARGFTETTWPSAPNLTYTWTEADGPMSLDADLMHVGIYSLKDTPWALLCGFNSTNGQTLMGFLPPAPRFEDFPSFGIISVEGVRYNYSGKVDFAEIVRGPFQGRNTGLDWNYTNDGEGYSGNSIEFLLFEWISNAANNEKYAGRILNINDGFAWPMQETDFKVYITTRGNQAYLRNRSRHFAAGIEGDHVGFSQKCYLTYGLSGVTLLEGEEMSHDEGAIAILETDADVIVKNFIGSSGDEDTTVEDMIEKLIHMSGGNVLFPGDIIVASQDLGTSEWTIA